MIDFKPVSLADRQWINRILRLEDSKGAEFCFTTIYVWDDTYHRQAAAFGDRLLTKLLSHSAPFYAFPVGAGPLAPAILALREDADIRGRKLIIRGITADNLLLLEAEFPGGFQISADTYAFDYVYEAEKLDMLSGKKLHGKRNHIHRFEEANDWRFEPVTSENLQVCAKMAEQWFLENAARGNYEQERLALGRVFAAFEALELEGGLLYASGAPIAFTIGEVLNSDTYVVHFEKAFSRIQGAYAMINREFVRHIRKNRPHIRYINREEDMGIESLQKAKRSYDPAFMVEKFTATWKASP